MTPKCATAIVWRVKKGNTGEGGHGKYTHVLLFNTASQFVQQSIYKNLHGSIFFVFKMLYHSPTSIFTYKTFSGDWIPDTHYEGGRQGQKEEERMGGG
jgi:hypothetical protein